MSSDALKKEVNLWIDECIELRKKFDRSPDGTENSFRDEIKKLHEKHDQLKKGLLQGDPKTKELESDLKLYNGDLEAMEDYIEKKSMTAKIIRFAMKKVQVE
jgi:hypothetical protein